MEEGEGRGGLWGTDAVELRRAVGGLSVPEGVGLPEGLSVAGSEADAVTVADHVTITSVGVSVCDSVQEPDPVQVLVRRTVGVRVAVALREGRAGALRVPETEGPVAVPVLQLRVRGVPVRLSEAGGDPERVAVAVSVTGTIVGVAV